MPKQLQKRKKKTIPRNIIFKMQRQRKKIKKKKKILKEARGKGVYLTY